MIKQDFSLSFYDIHQKWNFSLSFYVIDQIIWYVTKQRNKVAYWKKTVLVNKIWLKVKDTLWILTLTASVSRYKLINTELETMNNRIKKKMELNSYLSTEELEIVNCHYSK